MHNITYAINNGKYNTKHVLKNVSWQLEKGQRVGVLSRSMQEAQSFLYCASGVSTPQAGIVSIRANVSWPLGAKGGTSSSLSGRQNAKFLQGVYGHGGKHLRDLNNINWLASLGNYFDEPLKSYNKTMLSRFYLAIPLVFDFDVYIIPQQNPLKANTLSEKNLRLQKALKDQTFGKSLLMTNNDFSFLGQFCNEGIVLNQGSIAYSGSFSDCRAWYEANISKAPEEDIDLKLDPEETVPTTELESDILEDDLW